MQAGGVVIIITNNYDREMRTLLWCDEVQNLLSVL